VLFGGGSQDQGIFPGGQFTFGYWMGSSDSGVGMQVSGFYMSRGQTFSTTSDSNGNPSIGRPFVSAFTGAEQSFTVAFGDPAPFASGDINTHLYTQFWGLEYDMVFAAADTPTSHRTWLVGFRYADLTENLSIMQDTNLLPGAGILFNGQTVVLSPNGVAITDIFHTRNQFYGGQVGVRQIFDFGRFSIDASAKLALGSVHQVVEIQGSSSIVNSGVVTASVPGGFLALDTNIGRTTADTFAVLPEVDLKMGYKITEWLTAVVGYNFMYLNSVVRAGDQIDRTVNITHVPTSLAFGLGGGSSNPAPQFNRTDFWAQGITMGLLFKY
jgi:hypothetical protein